MICFQKQFIFGNNREKHYFFGKIQLYPKKIPVFLYITAKTTVFAQLPTITLKNAKNRKNRTSTDANLRVLNSMQLHQDCSVSSNNHECFHSDSSFVAAMVFYSSVNMPRHESTVHPLH